MKHWYSRLSPFYSAAFCLLVTWIALCGYAASHHIWRLTLLLTLASAAFVVGSLVGFVFTSYSDETATVGKVTNWLTGALAGVTVVEFRRLRSVVDLFAGQPGSTNDYAVALGITLTFAGLGFYFMFFARDLVFNIPLARKRAERFGIENTHEAGVVTIRLSNSLPLNLLVGTEDADDVLKDKDKVASLRKDLCSDDVTNFLTQSDQAIKAGQPLDWDVISKVANLQYYCAYFAHTEPDKQKSQQEAALKWILRALTLNPEHVDLSMKRADMLGALGRNREAVAVLEEMSARPDAPFFVEQWLGYYLTFLPGREDDALRRSQAYLARFPESNETQRNIASAYAQRACREARKHGFSVDRSRDYNEAIRQLREAIRRNPDYLSSIRGKWSRPDGPFGCFKDDPGYLQTLQSPLSAKPLANEPAPAAPETPNNPAQQDGLPLQESTGGRR